MTVEVAAMMVAGGAALAAGLALARPRFRASSCAERILVLGPVFAAAALAVFSMEHFTAAHDLAPLVPRWLPAPLFWVYFFGVALLAAAISFIIWRCVPWSASLLALFFLLVVATIALPSLPAHAHEHAFWTGAVRELCFAGGAMVLAGSVWPRGSPASVALIRIGRSIVAVVLLFYAIEHFLFPRFAPGVPLEKLTPVWVPAPFLLAYLIGITLLLAGIGLLLRPTIRIAAAACGIVLLLLTAFFYVPILALEFHTAAVEGLNYVFDTLLFAGTVLLAGLAADQHVI
jgi:uncharacterized membrane protein